MSQKFERERQSTNFISSLIRAIQERGKGHIPTKVARQEPDSRPHRGSDNASSGRRRG